MASNTLQHKKPHILAFCNSKGGSNKTTGAINVASELASRGFQVLVIDLDHQGNATMALRQHDEHLVGSTNQVLKTGQNLLDSLIATAIETLWLLPATSELYGLDTRLQSERPDDYHLILRTVLANEAGGFDYVVLDCPGNLQALCAMALAAADGYVVPMRPELFFFDVAKRMLEVARGYEQAGLTQNLQLAGLFFSPFNAKLRNTATKMIVNASEKAFPGLMMPGIREDKNINLAQISRTPVQVDEPNTRARLDFARLTDTILDRLGWPILPEHLNPEQPN